MSVVGKDGSESLSADMFSTQRNAYAVVGVISALGLNLYGIAFAHSLGLFERVTAWQITILTMSSSPIVVLHSLLPADYSSLKGPVSLLWIFLSLACRGFLMNLWSGMIIAYQLLIWTLHKVNPARCSAAYILGNLIVSIGFWVFVLGCSLNLSGTETTFHSIDRYLRRLKEFNVSAIEEPPSGALLIMILREAFLHGLVQFQCVGCLAYASRRSFMTRTTMYLACKDVLAFLALWILGSQTFSPDLMPYEALPPAPLAAVAVAALGSLLVL